MISSEIKEMKNLEYESTPSLVSLAFWYKGQCHSRITGDMDSTGELKRLVLESKIEQINAVLVKRRLEPIDVKEEA